MSRTRVRWARVAAAGFATVLTVSILAGRAGAGGGGAAPRHPSARTYVVRPGDTLWSIATGLVGPEGDPRPVVEELGRANQVEDSVIHVGDVLTVPAD